MVPPTTLPSTTTPRRKVSSALQNAAHGCSSREQALHHLPVRLARRYVYNKYGGSTAYGRGDFVETAYGPDGLAIGNRAESDWLWIVPWGFRGMLNWVNSRQAHLCMHLCPQELPHKCFFSILHPL